MFFGQINVPASLPIHVLIHLVNSKFLGWLYLPLPARQFFYVYNVACFQSLELLRGRRGKEHSEASFTHKAYSYMMYICVTACFLFEFSCCVSSLHSLQACKWERGLRDKLQINCGRECTHAIRKKMSQATLLLKGTKTNCPSMLMLKGYHFFCCLLHLSLFPALFQTDLFEILNRKPCEGTFFPIT